MWLELERLTKLIEYKMIQDTEKSRVSILVLTLGES